MVSLPIRMIYLTLLTCPHAEAAATYNSFFQQLLQKAWVLFENRPALYISNYKENKKNTRMLDTLFIDDSIYIMEQYFHY